MGVETLMSKIGKELKSTDTWKIKNRAKDTTKIINRI